MDRSKLARFALLSIGAALLTIGLKGGAYLVTGSVGLLSDALESGVNLAAAVIAYLALRYATRPPDEDHAFGHDKAEYFSSTSEGILIGFAAFGIVATSIPRLFYQQPLEQVGLGLVISVLAAGVNLITARALLRASKAYQSITLEADARHLMTDVWTSGAVLIGVAAVSVTGWLWLDPLIALIVGANILRTGFMLIWHSVQGLLDPALPPIEQGLIEAVVASHYDEGVRSHALLTRRSGSRRFISMHLLVPKDWTVSRGHALSEQIEGEIRAVLPNANVLTHIEPLEELVSFEDITLDRVTV
jgi:cation diffusion facilitator family transporter